MTFRTIKEIKISNIRNLFTAQCICGGSSKMFKVAFWMKKHLSLTWKRTWMWSQSRLIEELDLGALSPSEKTCEVRTAKTWVDSKGKKRWQGTRELKGTQQLDYMVRLVFQLFFCWYYLVYHVFLELYRIMKILI